MTDPKGNINLLRNFSPGDRVTLTRVKRAEYVGLRGTVVKTIKCHGEVRVHLEGTGKTYHAFPENLDKLEDANATH